MPDLSALIERLEGATGPDREIDAAILETNWKTRTLCRECWGLGGDMIRGDGDACRRCGRTDAAPLTASIDAALAFVGRALPGVMWRIGFDPDYGVMKAELVTAAPNCINKSARHEKVPLAILIAALKALQEREGEGSN